MSTIEDFGKMLSELRKKISKCENVDYLNCYKYINNFIINNVKVKDYDRAHYLFSLKKVFFDEMFITDCSRYVDPDIAQHFRMTNKINRDTSKESRIMRERLFSAKCKNDKYVHAEYITLIEDFIKAYNDDIEKSNLVYKNMCKDNYTYLKRLIDSYKDIDYSMCYSYLDTIIGEKNIYSVRGTTEYIFKLRKHFDELSEHSFRLRNNIDEKDILDEFQLEELIEEMEYTIRYLIFSSDDTKNYVEQLKIFVDDCIFVKNAIIN